MSFLNSATTRLTLWYIFILTVLSLVFSGVVYSIAASELHRPLALSGQRQSLSPLDEPRNFESWRQEREEEGKTRLITNLVIFNISVISTGGLASYYLARRTLRPIEEALDAQTRFTSDAAHELRTPLAVMQSEIEINLRNKNATIKEQRDILTSNLDEVARLRSLTDRLLLLSNLKSVELSTTSLDDVVTEAINRTVTFAQSKKIGIESTVGKQTATANAEILTDVLVILLDNAVKYSPKKSSVTIAAKEHNKQVVIEVSDNGSGIAAGDMPHIFDRFYRADSSRSKENVEGHGLGLSIAKKSVEAMGGQISATSKEGEGSVFYIKLPVS